jgi:amino acid transporter
MFAILVVGAGAQARLACSMARDNMLPLSGFLRRVNPRTQTPIVALLVFGVIDLGVMIYGYFQSSAYGTLVGATVVIPYIIYFLTTLAYAFKRRTTDSIPGMVNLGRWAWPMIGFVLVCTVIIMIILSVPATSTAPTSSSSTGSSRRCSGTPAACTGGCGAAQWG